MSIEQQPPKSNKIEVTDMPSIDRTVIPPKEHRDDKDEKKLGWKKPAAAVALLGAVAAGAFGGVKALGGESDSNSGRPNVEPSASAPATPGGEVTPSNPETEATAEPIELTVDRYDNGESLTRAWMEQYNDWMMAGATPETAENRDPILGLEEYIDSVTNPIDEAYLSALYVSDWQERPQLVKEVDDYTRIHHAIVYANMGTTDSGEPEDVEPYESTWDLTSVEEVSNTGDEIVVEYHYEVSDNSDRNRAEEFVTPTYSTPVPGGTRTTWIQENGVWKISDEVPLGY